MSYWPLAGLALIFCLVWGWNGLMIRHWDSVPVRLLTAIIPLPAVHVNGATITYHDLLQRKDVLRYLDGENKNEDQLLASATDVLIRQEAIAQIADKLHVEVTQEDSNAALSKLQGERSRSDFFTEVKDKLQMNERTFIREVVDPLALAQKLEKEVLASFEVQKVPRDTMVGVQARLAAGESFSRLAEAYSDDLSAENGGDIGYVTAETIPEGWEALLTTPDGGVTNIIETESSFVIAKVAWLVGSEANTEIRTQAIIVKKRTVNDVVEAFLATSTVREIIHINR